MKLLLTLILIAPLILQAQINVPQARITRNVDDYTETTSGDTTIIHLYDLQGHVFFIPIKGYPQTWYFVDGVSVKVIIRQSIIGHILDKRHVKRKWIEREGYHQKGNRAVKFFNNNYQMWKI